MALPTAIFSVEKSCVDFFRSFVCVRAIAHWSVGCSVAKSIPSRLSFL